MGKCFDIFLLQNIFCLFAFAILKVALFNNCFIKMRGLRTISNLRPFFPSCLEIIEDACCDQRGNISGCFLSGLASLLTKLDLNGLYLVHDILLLDFDWFYFNLESYFSIHIWGFIIIYWSWGGIQTHSLIYTSQMFYHWLVSSAPQLSIFF